MRDQYKGKRKKIKNVINKVFPLHPFGALYYEGAMNGK